MAQFLAKLAPRGWRTDTIDRATATINSSLKSAAKHFGNVAVNVTYRPRPLALPQISRYEKASAGRTDANVKECFFASGNSGAFVFGGILFPREHASEFLPLSGFLFARN